MLVSASLLALSLVTIGADAQSVANVLTSQPAYSVNVPKDFLGLSIETTSWIGWAGNSSGQVNPFTQTALSNLQKLTNTPVPIRVGGGTEDDIYIDPNVNTYYQKLNATPTTRSIAISKEFFGLSGNFPRNTPFTWGLNFASLNVTQMTDLVSALAAVFQGAARKQTQGVILERVELGNEMDFLGSPFFFPQGPGAAWNVLAYASQFETYLNAITQQIRFGGQGPKLQIGDFANADPRALPLPGIPPLYTFWPTGIVGSGILESKYGNLISTYATHHYDASARQNPPSGSIFQRSAIRGNVSSAITGSVQIRRAGLDFIMGEMNSISSSGTAGVSNSLEGALFTVDYALQYAVNEVKRVHFHNGNGSAYNFIQPTPVGNVSLTSTPTRVPTEVPHIGAPYYGGLVINEFIGSEKNAYVAELSVSSGTISGYAVYVNNQIKRVILMNYTPYLADGSARSTQTVTLSGLRGQRGSIKRLTAPYLSSITGITWGGISYDTPDASPTGTAARENYGGTGTINVDASSLAMIFFN